MIDSRPLNCERVAQLKSVVLTSMVFVREEGKEGGKERGRAGLPGVREGGRESEAG